MSFRFDGQTVLVSGAGHGLGRAIAQSFAGLGAVVHASDLDAAELAETAAGHAAIHTRALDLTDRDTAGAWVRGLGRIDVLVNNAGGSPPADAATASPRFSAAIIQLNLVAPLVFAQRANAVMQKQESGGTIVNIASVSATRPSPGTAAYGAAKAGLVNLTQSLAVEWAPKVRVNAVVAGIMRTEKAHLHYGDETAMARVARTIPLGRMGEPDDVADACLYLASPLARWVSGACLAVHGGGEVPAFLRVAEPT